MQELGYYLDSEIIVIFFLSPCSYLVLLRAGAFFIFINRASPGCLAYRYFDKPCRESTQVKEVMSELKLQL